MVSLACPQIYIYIECVCMIWNLWSSSCGPCSEYPMGTPKSAVSNGFNPSSQYLSSVAQNPVMPFTGWLRTGFLLWVFWATGQRQRHTSNQNLRVHLHDYCNRIITQYKPVVMEYTAEIYGLSTTLTRSRTPQYLNVHDVHAAQVALFTKRRPRPKGVSLVNCNGAFVIAILMAQQHPGGDPFAT